MRNKYLIMKINEKTIRKSTSPGCDTVGDGQRASRYALRVSRSVVVSLSLSPRNAASVGDAQRASRYALRASRSVVVSLSLSRRSGI